MGKADLSNVTEADPVLSTITKEVNEVVTVHNLRLLLKYLVRNPHNVMIFRLARSNFRAKIILKKLFYFKVLPCITMIQAKPTEKLSNYTRNCLINYVKAAVLSTISWKQLPLC